MSEDLVAFLRRMFDAEQAEAEKLPDVDDYSLEPWAIQWEETGEWNSYGYLRIAKARVLREIEAKRQLIALAFKREATVDGEWGCGHSAEGIEAGRCPEHNPNDIPEIRLLALPYAGHPDHRDE
jgi:hypothetical protein